MPYYSIRHVEIFTEKLVDSSLCTCALHVHSLCGRSCHQKSGESNFAKFYS